MTDTDVKLLSRIAGGNEAALEEFYRKYGQAVYKFAISRLGNEFEAADCLNEVMMEVWKHADRYGGRSKVRTWLLGITNHKVIDHLRKRYRFEHEDLDEQMPDEDAASMADVLAAMDDAGVVQKCLQGLTDNHRQVIHLAFFEDLPYEEIALITGCPEGTVKTRIFHAKQNLKACLELNHYEDQ